MNEAFLEKNNPIFDRIHSAETKAKISAIQEIFIYVYFSDKSTLFYIFYSANKAREFFNCHYQTILKYAKNGKLFKKLLILIYNFNFFR